MAKTLSPPSDAELVDQIQSMHEDIAALTRDKEIWRKAAEQWETRCRDLELELRELRT